MKVDRFTGDDGFILYLKYVQELLHVWLVALVTAIGQVPSHRYPASSQVDKTGVCDRTFLNRKAAVAVGSS